MARPRETQDRLLPPRRKGTLGLVSTWGLLSVAFTPDCFCLAAPRAHKEVWSPQHSLVSVASMHTHTGQHGGKGGPRRPPQN